MTNEQRVIVHEGLTFNNDTIVAQATASGRSGIAVIRVSGTKVPEIIQAIVGKSLNPRQANYVAFQNEAGDALDEGIAIYFPQPNSFTGEDILELHGHGGAMVVDLILKRLIDLGARLARPGEFSERAFLNGKMDLTQAEAIADLIDAASHEAARSALRSLQGAFSKEINHLNEKLIQLRMYLEASIDFADEEIEFLQNEKIIQALRSLIQTLQQIQSKAKQGSVLREGLSAVIVGQPNVGKSSLLNALCRKESAIVTHIPGTTRDVLREYVLIDGMPLYIIDTAGLRESNDIVELEGIKRAHQEIEQADVILYVIEATEKNAFDTAKLPFSITSQYLIIIQNKIDLIDREPAIIMQAGTPIISLSARYDKGINLLRAHIKSYAGLETQEDGLFLARRRHLDALQRAMQHMHAALTQLETIHSIELAAEDLRLAQCALNEITGEFTADDLLGRIFSSFCIGK